VICPLLIFNSLMVRSYRFDASILEDILRISPPKLDRFGLSVAADGLAGVVSHNRCIPSFVTLQLILSHAHFQMAEAGL